jgi:hypothetical protein
MGWKDPVRARFSATFHMGPGAHTASYKMETGLPSWGKLAEACHLTSTLI